MTSSLSSTAQRAVGAVHSRAVFGRRVRVLASTIAGLLPDHGTVLDVGCGSGDLAKAISTLKPKLKLEGVDVLVRPGTAISVKQFNGTDLPFPDSSFDYALLVDVLHHTDDPKVLLKEVARVARHVIVKDHYRDPVLGFARLRFMDWVGNAPHGVRLPYNYLTRAKWAELWQETRLNPDEVIEDLPLYPIPAQWMFGDKLHFTARLSRR